ncbi:acyl-CoA dehydrogenase family protein [Sandarakinorhabdus sp. DWP1-3-1]|uniref:acyl-CoA dehydrogenase family protein n=1 Tax=Sandarakinorhabdus sp. DWP1-3-1 TaxID=2804627 RepID=UPI003CF61B3A
MDFSLSPEQQLLQDALATYLARHHDLEARRVLLVDGRRRAAVWQDLAGELGLFGSAVPAELEGFGGGPVETMLIMEKFGEALLVVPYLECVTLATALLRPAGAAVRDTVAGIVDGRLRIAPALHEDGGRFNLAHIETRIAGGRLSGAKIAVAGAADATHFLVSARTPDGTAVLALVAVEAAGLARQDYAFIDGRSAADLTFDGTPATAVDVGGDALPVIERSVDEAIAGLCAEALGVMETALALTVDYARQRQQFGKAIGQFQALQHRMVDMRTQIELSRSLTLMATLSLDAPRDERRKAVSAAKAYVSDALRIVGQGAVQIHGGIGTTDEIAISHYFRRATVMESQFGSAAHHLKLMAAVSE